AGTPVTWRSGTEAIEPYRSDRYRAPRSEVHHHLDVGTDGDPIERLIEQVPVPHPHGRSAPAARDGRRVIRARPARDRHRPQPALLIRQVGEAFVEADVEMRSLRHRATLRLVARMDK